MKEPGSSALDNVSNYLPLQLIAQNLIRNRRRELHSYRPPAPEHIEIVLRGGVKGLRGRPRDRPCLLLLKANPNINRSSRRSYPQSPHELSLLPIHNPLARPLPSYERDCFPLRLPFERNPIIRRARIIRIELRRIRPAQNHLPARQKRPRFTIEVPLRIRQIIPRCTRRCFSRSDCRIAIVNFRLCQRSRLSELIIPYRCSIRVNLSRFRPTEYNFIPKWIHEHERINIAYRVHHVIEILLIARCKDALI